MVLISIADSNIHHFPLAFSLGWATFAERHNFKKFFSNPNLSFALQDKTWIPRTAANKSNKPYKVKHSDLGSWNFNSILVASFSFFKPSTETVCSSHQKWYPVRDEPSEKSSDHKNFLGILVMLLPVTETHTFGDAGTSTRDYRMGQFLV